MTPVCRTYTEVDSRTDPFRITQSGYYCVKVEAPTDGNVYGHFHQNGTHYGNGASAQDGGCDFQTSYLDLTGNDEYDFHSGSSEVISGVANACAGEMTMQPCPKPEQGPGSE